MDYAQEAAHRMIHDAAGGATHIDDGVLRRMAVSVLVENFFGLPFRDTGIDLGRIAELMEYGSAYAFVPAGRTDVIYGDALRRLPSLRRQVLGDLRVFRGGTMPRSAMLDGMLAANIDKAANKLIQCFEDRAKQIYGVKA